MSESSNAGLFRFWAKHLPTGQKPSLYEAGLLLERLDFVELNGEGELPDVMALKRAMLTRPELMSEVPRAHRIHGNDLSGDAWWWNLDLIADGTMAAPVLPPEEGA